MVQLLKTAAGMCLLLFISPVESKCSAGPLRVEILRGEGANNNGARGVSISPTVRVIGRDGKPVEGALVLFSPPERGPSVSFSGFDAEAAMLTDEAGVAIAPRQRPIRENGPVEIRVTASHGGEFAHGVVRQMNLGVGTMSEQNGELHVVEIRDQAGALASRRRQTTIRVRVEFGEGQPVASAAVAFTLRRVMQDGRKEELSRTLGSTAADGTAMWILPRAGSGHLEMVVQAESEGRRATVVFSLN